MIRWKQSSQNKGLAHHPLDKSPCFGFLCVRSVRSLFHGSTSKNINHPGVLGGPPKEAQRPSKAPKFMSAGWLGGPRGPHGGEGTSQSHRRRKSMASIFVQCLLVVCCNMVIVLLETHLNSTLNILCLSLVGGC